MSSFGYNQKGSLVHAVDISLTAVSETDISSIFPLPSSWRASLNFPFSHGQDLWLGFWTLEVLTIACFPHFCASDFQDGCDTS